MTLYRLQATHKHTLLLPQNCSKGGAGETGTFVWTNTIYPYSTLLCVVFFTLTDRASTIPSTVIYYVVANPVRGLLDIKRSEEHLPSSSESKRKTQTNKNDKEKGTRITKYACQKKIDEGHSIERVWHSASREPSDTLPGSQPYTQTRSIYHIPYS